MGEAWGMRSTLGDMAPDSNVESHRAGVAALIRARGVRETLLPADWFADIAWDLMLALYSEHLDGHPLSFDAIQATPRASSRLRWIDVIIAQGLADRCQDGVRLTASGVSTMHTYFKAMTAG